MVMMLWKKDGDDGLFRYKLTFKTIMLDDKLVLALQDIEQRSRKYFMIMASVMVDSDKLFLGESVTLAWHLG